jgi:hypothetical protein
MKITFAVLDTAQRTLAVSAVVHVLNALFAECMGAGL